MRVRSSIPTQASMPAFSSIRPRDCAAPQCFCARLRLTGFLPIHGIGSVRPSFPAGARRRPETGAPGGLDRYCPTGARSEGNPSPRVERGLFVRPSRWRPERLSGAVWPSEVSAAALLPVSSPEIENSVPPGRCGHRFEQGLPEARPRSRRCAGNVPSRPAGGVARGSSSIPLVPVPARPYARIVREDIGHESALTPSQGLPHYPRGQSRTNCG